MRHWMFGALAALMLTPLAAFAHELDDDLDPEEDDRRRRAEHADGEGREERHLLERVLRHGGADEPDEQHRDDHADDQGSILHTVTLA